METPGGVRKSNFARVAYVGFCFTMLFTAYSSAQDLVTHIYTQLGYDNLGQVCLFTLYAFYGLASSVSSYYKNKMTARVGFIIGSSTYSAFICAGLFTTYCGKYGAESSLCTASLIYFINVSSCIILGVGASLLWICQATYVNACAEEDTKGYFNGVFWSIMQPSQIISSAIATFVLGYTDQYVFYIVLCAFSILSTLMFFRVKQPISQAIKEQEPAFEPPKTATQAFYSFFSTLSKEKYRFLFINMLMSGLIVAFYANFLANTVVSTVDADDENDLNQKVGYAIVALALGEISAGVIMGRIADMYNKITLLNLVIIFPEIALVTTFFAFIFESYMLALVSGFFWGFSETTAETLVSSVIGFYFDGNPELYSSHMFLQGCGIVFGSSIAVIIPSSWPLLYLGIIAGAVVILHSLFLYYKGNKQTLHVLGTEQTPLMEMKDI